MQIEMTGKQDMETPWNYAICGFAGAGKTLLASTAPDPLFVFFQENPRLKSIADRYIPHVKIVNDDDGLVLEKMLTLATHLAVVEHDYKTLVIDTGDELFREVKRGRSRGNDGEFGPGDWGWLGDTYSEMMTSLVDLDMRLIVLFHVKNTQDGDDGQMVRELLLQGSAKDEAAGWFDVVAMLDAFEVIDDDTGETETRRGLLTHTSRLHPWVKDHSGQMPRRYELSQGFVGDIVAIEEVLTKEVAADKVDLEEIASHERSEEPSNVPVPTPEQVKAQKEANAGEVQIDAALTAVTEVLEVAEIMEEESVEPNAPTFEAETPTDEKAKVDESDGQPEKVSDEKTEEVVEDMPEKDLPSDERPKTRPPATPPPEDDEAVDETPLHECAECGKEVDNHDLINMSRAKYKAVYCREHFRARVRGTN